MVLNGISRSSNPVWNSLLTKTPIKFLGTSLKHTSYQASKAWVTCTILPRVREARHPGMMPLALRTLSHGRMRAIPSMMRLPVLDFLLFRANRARLLRIRMGTTFVGGGKRRVLSGISEENLSADKTVQNSHSVPSKFTWNGGFRGKCRESSATKAPSTICIRVSCLSATHFMFNAVSTDERIDCSSCSSPEHRTRFPFPIHQS